MLYFVIIYVVLAIMGFACFLVKYKNKRETRKFYEASEKIISEDLLAYSLKNPYIRNTGEKLPLSRRLMLGVKISNGKTKKSMVFDPEKVVYIGHSVHNHIVIYNLNISERHCCIFLEGGRIWISDLSNKRGFVLKHKGSRKVVTNGGTTLLHSGDTIHIGSVKIKTKIFWFDINHK